MKKIYTKKELAKKYGINYKTFINWINQIPNLNLIANSRLLNPKQVALIFEQLGEP